MANNYDVVVVGGSIAGCSTAMLLARRGARVAVVEKSPDLDAYKKVCSHFIQAGAEPYLKWMGILPAMQEAGAVPSHINIWTQFGWIEPPKRDEQAWNLRRSKLDPLIRRMAISTPGVSYFSGLTAVGLVGDERINGVRIAGRDRVEQVLRARVVVAADGRASQMARYANVHARVRETARFSYFGYLEGVPLPKPNLSLAWLGDPNMGAMFPNDDGLTMVTTFVERSRWGEFKNDPDAAIRAHFRRFPDAPDLDGATLAGQWVGQLRMPNEIRPAASGRIAFVGDAAQATDPFWGVGCGWAFQSAVWLDQTVGRALQGSDAELDRALQSYAKYHRRQLAAHHFFIADFSSGRPFHALENLVFSTAVHDPGVAGRFEVYGSRSVPGLSGASRALTRAAATRVSAALGL